ncbi:glucosamine-6-phosphate deaminase [Cohnella sp. REN36]|uniref:glucosamine-6-phosphate deaminase n=1 Tax=Cohnella sp. REN36 TaxID=2887347 RepID=UPI001D1363B1|nr:glucosamine-6-phosphate deaminase [Cohnella sp. REN36]MCC3373608.1 glucosamine-6-phosphate deaminase [Cohnella sp. REN36]
MTDGSAIRKLTVDRLQIEIYENREALGQAAGRAVAARIQDLLGQQAHVRMIFAAAPSQNELLDQLVRDWTIDWSRVTAFHMDEYIGLPADAPQSFSRFLRERLFDRVNFRDVHTIDPSNDRRRECDRYGGLLREAPIDIVCLGIGENGHLAFNDPPVADFRDPASVKVVELDEVCRRQQVNDGCFARLQEVPTHAITLTIPTLLSASHLFCVVPGPSKRQAVTATLQDPIGAACPSTILRTHPDCTLYVDRDAFGEP